MKTRSLALPLLGSLVAAGCVINTGGDSSDDTEGDAATETEGSSGDESGGTAEGGDGDGDDGDETGGDETGEIVDTCDDVEVGASVFHHSGTIGDETWALGTHVVDGGLWIEGHVEVAACARIEMSDAARITVGDGGSLAMRGEAGSPIRVTSAKSSPAAGDWERIELRASSVGPENVLSNVVVEYGGASWYGMIYVEDGASLSMSDSIARHSAGFGMVVSGGELRDFTGNAIVDNASGAIEISPDHVGDLGVGTYAPNDDDGIVITSGAVEHDQVWLAHDAPYVAPSGFQVRAAAGSAHLTVQAGAELRMGDAASIFVEENGGLTLAGTADAPISVRSAKSAGSAGDWNEIRIEPDSVDSLNDFDHVVIEHGGGSWYGMVYVQDGASLAMTSCTARESLNTGVMADDGAELRDFTGNVLTDNVAGPIMVSAESVDALGPGTYGPNTVEGVLVSGGTVDHDATWLELGVPYVASGGFTVAAETGSANLAVSAGTSVLLGDGGVIRVGTNGSLALEGTADAPIVVDSAKSSPAAGDWNEIRIEDGSIGPNNVFRHTSIAHGGGSWYGMLWVQDGAELTLDTVTFAAPGDGCDVDRDGTINATSSTYVECP
jgi:hypothetical protein